MIGYRILRRSICLQSRRGGPFTVIREKGFCTKLDTVKIKRYNWDSVTFGEVLLCLKSNIIIRI